MRHSPYWDPLTWPPCRLLEATEQGSEARAFSSTLLVDQNEREHVDILVLAELTGDKVTGRTSLCKAVRKWPLSGDLLFPPQPLVTENRRQTHTEGIYTPIQLLKIFSHNNLF